MLGKEPWGQLLLLLARSDVCYSWTGSCEDQARESEGESLAMPKRKARAIGRPGRCGHMKNESLGTFLKNSKTAREKAYNHPDRWKKGIWQPRLCS